MENGEKAETVSLFAPSDRVSFAGFTRTKNFLIVQTLDNVKTHLTFWTDSAGGGQWVKHSEEPAPSIRGASIRAVDDDESDEIFFTTSRFVSNALDTAGTPRQLTRWLRHLFIYFYFSATLSPPPSTLEMPQRGQLASRWAAASWRSSDSSHLNLMLRELKSPKAWQHRKTALWYRTFLFGSHRPLTRRENGRLKQQCYMGRWAFCSEKNILCVFFFYRLYWPHPPPLVSYGGFEISMTPYYISTVGAGWLERGGAFAVANIRGGGEFGAPPPTCVWEMFVPGDKQFVCPPSHLCVRNVCPPGTNKSVTDGQTDKHSALYI